MPEHVARLVRSLALPMTSQSLADLALQADRDRRAALKRGDTKRALELEAEISALAELMP